MRRNSLIVLGLAMMLFGSAARPTEARGQWYRVLAPPPIVEPPFCSIRLQIPQRDALVFVDGFEAGVVDDFDGVFQRLQVIPGHHEIVVYLHGHRTFRQNLYVNPRSAHTIKHTLAPLAPGDPPEPPPVPRPLPPPGAAIPYPLPPVVAQSGALVLRVQPRDANIYIDNELWRGPQGQERLVIQLPEGSHSIRIEKAGHETFSTPIDVRVGETTTLNVTLQ